MAHYILLCGRQVSQQWRREGTERESKNGRFQEWFSEEVGTAQTEGTEDGVWEVLGMGLALSKEKQKGVRGHRHIEVKRWEAKEA